MEQFRSPPARFRAAPFWAWNTRLEKERLFRQIDVMREMGMGGFHLHVRTGLEDEYLGSSFFDSVRSCVDKARRDGLYAYLYDEDRWPSGSGGGIVTRDPQFRARFIVWTRTHKRENDRLLARYEVVLKNGYLACYRRLSPDEAVSTEGQVWSAFLQVAGPSSWFNGQAYVDTLNPAAIRRFIEVTYEAYRRELRPYFGCTVPSIFTDEPQVHGKDVFESPYSGADITIPFTDDFFETYTATYGDYLEDKLPELFWDLPAGRASSTRYRYHDHIAERFASAFGDQIAGWCEKNGLILTGHMLGEGSLHSQTAGASDVMRSLRAFQLPGIDILFDRAEYRTAKQAQSIAHQFGREGIMSELYGVTNWDVDFTIFKGQGDWQAALGVTLRVPHLAWVSMAGEAKRDWPGPIGYQASWWREYPLIEDYFARINTVLSRGQPATRIAVIHPIESYWICFGPLSQNVEEQQRREQQFSNLAEWLLFGWLDFDYVSESLIPALWKSDESSVFTIGVAKYEAVLVPALRTLRSSTVDALEKFVEAGGKVIFAGEIPALVDAVASDRVQKLARRCQCVEFVRDQIIRSLLPWQDVCAIQRDGSVTDSLLHQRRLDGEEHYIFVCNTDRVRPRPGVQVCINGSWEVVRLNSFNGATESVNASLCEGKTYISLDFEACDSLLLQLKQGRPKSSDLTAYHKCASLRALSGPVPVTLSDLNCLLLDQPVWRVDEEPWQPAEEILRLDNKIRARYGAPARGGSIAQPWVHQRPSDVLARISLKYIIETTVPVKNPLLAMERLEGIEIEIDGVPTQYQDTGWWVDEAIRTTPLPDIATGIHELVLKFPFSERTDLERCYLLGDFGVEVIGHAARLTEPVKELSFGDWTTQGLPFYAGNVTYHTELVGDGNSAELEVSDFKAPLIVVSFDGRRVGPIAFPPFRLPLGVISSRVHRLDITSYGNRFNAFAAIHHTDKNLVKHSPASFRSEGVEWTYDYLLKPGGILSSPQILLS